MKGFFSKKSNFVKLFTLTLSISILGSWGCFYWMTNGLEQVNLSSEGLSTCFSRVSQNYSGKMIGGNQIYTSSDFYQMTEECFSDLENVIKKSYFLSKNEPILSDFKDLVKKSYWFHRDDITVNDFVEREEDGTKVMTKNYQEIEGVYERLTGNFTTVRSEINSRKDWVFYLGLFSVMTMGLITVLGISNSRISLSNKEVSTESIQQDHSINEIFENVVDLTTTTARKEGGLNIKGDASVTNSILSPGPEKFEVFFNRFLKMIAPRLIRRGVNFDFFIDSGMPRVINPGEQQRDLEIFFERSMNFNLGGGRVNRVDCYPLNPKKNEIRFYDSGVCLLKTLKHFKNVRSTSGLVLGVEYKHTFNVSRKGKVQRLLKGKKKDLVKELSNNHIV